MGACISGPELGANAMTWSLSWQAAVGRNFLVHAELAARIRYRLIGAHQRPGRQLLYFVLMPTEIHAIARVDDGEAVGSIARSFSHVLSRWVREAQTVRGPVFAGPCHAEPIESTQALRREVLMQAWRPVKLRLCSTAVHYPHGALRIAQGLKPNDGFDSRPLRAVFGESLSGARSAIKSFVRRCPAEEDWRAWELTRGLALPAARVGTQPAKVLARSVESAAARLIAAGGSLGIEGALHLLETWVGAKIHPSGRLDLHRGSGMRASRGRALVACLAVNHRLCSAAAVGRHFGRARATLSEQMTACRSRRADRAILATPLRRILADWMELRGLEGK